MSPTRIIYHPGGDVEKEKELKKFALHQQFLLHDLMKFQNLKQDQRRLELVGGGIITVKSCFGQDQIEIYVPPSEVPIVTPSTEILYVYSVDYSGNLSYWFIWDLSLDDYAEINDSYGDLIPASAYPVQYSLRYSPWSTLSGRLGKYRILVDSHYVVSSFDGVLGNFNLVKTGDFFYKESQPWKWTRVTVERYRPEYSYSYVNRVVLDDKSVLDEAGKVYCLAVSLPMFYIEEAWIPKFGQFTPAGLGAELCSTTVVTNPSTGTTTNVHGCKEVDDRSLEYVVADHNTYVTSVTTEEVHVAGTGSINTDISANCGTAVVYTGPSGGSLPEIDYVWAVGFYWLDEGHTIPEYFVSGIDGASVTGTRVSETELPYRYSMKGNFSGDYQKEYDYLTVENETVSALNKNVYDSDYDYNVTLECYYTYGMMNPLKYVSYYYCDPTPGDIYGDLPFCYGEFAEVTNIHACQFYTYPNFETNTSAQCEVRATQDAPVTTIRSTKLEVAIKALIDASPEINNTITIYGEIYSEKGRG